MREEGARLPGFKSTFYHLLAKNDFSSLVPHLQRRNDTKSYLSRLLGDWVSVCVYSVCRACNNNKYWHNAKAELRFCRGSMVCSEKVGLGAGEYADRFVSC